jgi:hypothetical protein
MEKYTSSAMPTEGVPVSMPGYDWDTIYHSEVSFKKMLDERFLRHHVYCIEEAGMRHLNFTTYIVNWRFSLHQGYQKILLIHIDISSGENP